MMMKRLAGSLLEVAACLAACWLVFALVFDGGSIPDEPEDQSLESIDHHPDWGSPRSSGWYAVRNRFVGEHPACEACGIAVELNVHHVKPFHEHPELELDPSNLITLCREHHFRVGHDPDGPWGPKRPNWKASNPLVREHAKKIRESSR